MHNENIKLYNMAENKTSSNLKKDPEMKLGFFTILFAKIFKSFL